MAKGLPKSLGRGEPIVSAVTRITIPVRNVPISVANGSSAPGRGTVNIGGLPKGNLIFLGAISSLMFQALTTEAISSWEGDYSIGITPNADADLADAGEANLIPSTPIGPAIGRLIQLTRGANATPVVIDNTLGTYEVNLNLLMDDASQSDDVTVNANGYVMLAVIVMGDSPPIPVE